MIYLVKLVACSASFLLVYLFLLQREKMFVFNRIFLLAGLILPFFIPLMTLNLNWPSVASGIPFTEDWIPALPTLTKAANSTSEVVEKAPVHSLPILYLFISGVLLLRFVLNLLNLWRRIRLHEQIPFLNATLVLVDKPISPHSFMRYILVNRKAWQAGDIDKEILYHEYVHGRLFHSVDILLVEWIQVFCWFNPVLYFYKRAMGLNHEFEVDERVVNYFNNPGRYQYLLVHHLFIPTWKLTHSFNFIHLKKRICMISSKPRTVLIYVKIAVTAVVIGFFVLLFAEKKQTVKSALQAEAAPAPAESMPTETGVDPSDFRLPTEAEWEYAARASGGTPAANEEKNMDS